MLSPEDVAFVKALVSASGRISPALLQELRKALGEKRRRSLDPSHQPLHVPSKRKADELTDSVCSSEPASRRPAADVESVLTADEQAASSGRQLGPPEGAATNAAVAAGPVAPQQPGGQLKPPAKGLDSFKPADSSESALGRTSNDVSGPLCSMPVVTTDPAQSVNTCLPAGERPNKKPIFISCVGDTRAFLACLRSSCPTELTAQLKADRLIVVPATANGFRAAVSALRSLEGKDGVSFHNFSLPEDRSVRLLIKNLGRRMPESAVREELESLGIHVQEVTQLRSGRRD
jgi:hypothetical protein